MKFTRTYLIGLCTLGGLCFISADLSAFGRYDEGGSLIKEILWQSSFGTSKNWSDKYWIEGPKIEIVKERKGTLLTLRSHQADVDWYHNIQGTKDEH